MQTILSIRDSGHRGFRIFCMGTGGYLNTSGNHTYPATYYKTQREAIQVAKRYFDIKFLQSDYVNSGVKPDLEYQVNKRKDHNA